MKIASRIIFSVLMISVACANTEPAVTGSELPLEAYATVGSSFAQENRLAELGWTSAQIEAFLEGMREAFQQRPRPVDAHARALQEQIFRRLRELAAANEQRMRDHFKDPAQREQFIKEATKTYGLERTDSGLAFKIKSRGAGARPEPDDIVVLTYTVTAPDAKTNFPQLAVQHRSIKVTELLPGLAEAVQMMGAGDSALLIIPPELTYGANEWPPGVSRDLPLLFAVELEQIKPRS